MTWAVTSARIDEVKRMESVTMMVRREGGGSLILTGFNGDSERKKSEREIGCRRFAYPPQLIRAVRGGQSLSHEPCKNGLLPVFKRAFEIMPLQLLLC